MKELDQTKAISKICRDLREDQPRTRQSIDQSSEHVFKSFDSVIKDESVSLGETLLT